MRFIVEQYRGENQSWLGMWAVRLKEQGLFNTDVPLCHPYSILHVMFSKTGRDFPDQQYMLVGTEQEAKHLAEFKNDSE